MITVAITAPAFAEESPKKVGKALVTYYWLIDETSSRYHGKRSAVLRDVRGKTIASTTPRFKRDLVMEGSGWLRDGRTVMFDRRKDGESRFRITKAKYGLTITGCPLDPYRSIAVDPKFVKPGSTIYIPQLKGAKLPDGTEHDGKFIASDRGHFHGAHIDIFTGVGPHASRPFTRKGIASRSHVTVYVIPNQDRGDCKE